MLFGWSLLGLLFPVPLRSLFLANLGLALFTRTLAILEGVGIDAVGYLQLGPDREHPWQDLEQLSQLLWLVYGLGWLSWRLLASPLVVLVTWVMTAGIVTWSTSRWGRAHLIKSFLRTINPLRWSLPTILMDVVMGDVLTSYAKIFAEWDVLLFCYLLSPREPSGGNLQCLPSLLTVFLVCYPYFCRFRQSIADYLSSTHKTTRHLWNALKYSISFPLIYVSYLVVYPQLMVQYHRTWLLLLTINTCYCCFWDFAMDWDLGYLTLSKTSLGGGNFLCNSPPLLRPILHFANRPWIYYMAVIFNILARASWTIRMYAASLYPLNHPLIALLDSSDAIFVMQLVEIARRFVWLVFRLEAYHVQQQRLTIVT